jgi:hypothetical protein
MIRVACALVAVVAASSCTLLLPTSELIGDCTSQADCGEGFVCEQQACLPEDEDDGSTSG